MKNLRIALFLVAFIVSSRAATVLSFYGEGYIGLNREWTLSPETGFEAGFQGTQAYQNEHGAIRFFSERDTPWQKWNLTLVAPNNTDLTLGMYIGSRFGGFEGLASIDFYGDGRGMSEVTGWFNILELTWNPHSSTPASLAVDFYTASPGPPTWTRGSLRYNSDIPLSQVPEPSSALLVLVAILGLTRRQR